MSHGSCQVTLYRAWLPCSHDATGERGSHKTASGHDHSSQSPMTSACRLPKSQA